MMCKVVGGLALVCLLSGFRLAVAQNAVPFVNTPLVPGAVAPGGPGFMLAVHGTGFVSGSKVEWNGAPLATTFVSGSQLTATVPAANIAATGTASITVVNPSMKEASNVAFLPIGTPSSTVFYANAPASPIFLGGPETAPEEPVSMAVGDFNGDGKLDLALGMNQDNNPSFLRIFLGNGDGTFTPLSSSVPLGLNPGAIVVGDFNGDGKLDLAASNFGNAIGGPDGNTVTILLGSGDGTFAPAHGSPVSVGASPAGILAGDFNGDGKLDLAVANSTDNTLSILLGNGDGTFTPSPSQPVTGLTPSALAAGDFNGDGKLDLAVANFYDNATILLGNGDGTFTPAPAQPMTVEGPGIVAGDFNGDGKLDLGVANQGDSTVSVLLGNGDGTFSPISNCCGDSVNLTHTLGMTLGDFNGDGRPDMALAIQNLETGPVGDSLDYVAILLGNANGTFTPTNYSLILPNDPYSMVTGDFNRDGKLDFATASNPYNYLSVLLQPPTALPAPDFAIAPPVAPLIVQAGNAATSSVQLTSLNGFTGPVSLSCSGTPANATCSVPSSVYLFNTVDAPTVSVTTTAPSRAEAAAGFMAPPQNSGPLSFWGAFLGCMLFTTLIRVRQKAPLSSALAFALMGFVLLAGCGGGGPAPTPPPSGTPTGNYELTVTGTSGSLTHSATIMFTVQ